VVVAEVGRQASARKVVKRVTALASVDDDLGHAIEIR
jgi:hypothetical protein